ncbi:hypothetical protein C8F04DRAFT_1274777 [Mycena alexandri]|uniref:Uncharacterized protein n=1 Tax=Mycena alexandri TaxID=1745969 RepID=A0AAD6S4Z7_9AGAR|nr:hypothetical protein C8F04DRAFT_1274777 [Mycena alexandri]
MLSLVMPLSVSFVNRLEEFASFMLEDMKPTKVCNLCLARGHPCVFFAWGRACESCEERFSSDCSYRNVNEWEDFRRSSDFNPNAGKFGRDLVPLDRLFDYIHPAFSINNSVYNKRLLLLKEKLNLMTSLPEVLDLHNKWAEDDFDYAAIFFVRRRMEELNDGLGSFTFLNS